MTCLLLIAEVFNMPYKYKYRYQLGPFIEETHGNFENMCVFLEKKSNQTLAEQKTVEYAFNKKAKKERECLMG